MAVEPSNAISAPAVAGPNTPRIAPRPVVRRPGADGPPDLVVFSHLRWSWVWQRPQQLIARFAEDRVVWFVEQPIVDPDVEEPVTHWEPTGPVTVVRRHVPGVEHYIDFEAPEASGLGEEVAQAAGGRVDAVWLYTPLALVAARAVPHRTFVYDVMDDLASFKNASARMPAAHQEVLEAADLVFAGGRSLHRDVSRVRPDAVLFPSGVQPEHYASASARRTRTDVAVAGYVGVIDERLDLDLIAGVADRLDDWQIVLVGPVDKVDQDELPRRSNIFYPGPAAYDELPAAMAGFQVAIMPFAHNAATLKISPTKTLEYLAAGLPVVSTGVADVVADFAHIVRIAEGSDDFAAACRRAHGDAFDTAYHARCRPLLEWHRWDRIAGRMAALVGDAERGGSSSMDATA